MTTQSFSADSAKQYVGTPMNAPTGMATILMKTNRYYTDGTLLKTGISYSVTTAWAKTAVDSGWAKDVPQVLPELPTPGGLTAAQVAATQALVSKDGTSGAWRQLPASGPLMRVRMTGTGTVSMDSATGDLGAGTVTTAVYTAAVVGTQIDAYAYPGDAARSIRITLTGTAAVEVY